VPPRIDALEPAALDIVAAGRGIEEGAFLSVRREVRRRAGPGSTDAVVAQLGAVAGALEAVIQALPARAFALPGGEADWNVAQALGHAADSRAGLALAAGLAASGRFPPDAPHVVPSIPGDADATREQLVRRIERSQRLIERSARQVAGHETDPCPLVHPLVGQLRCGEWLLFAGVHDLMHLEQLEGIEAQLAGTPAARP
jgi:hypothetical protein